MTGASTASVQSALHSGYELHQAGDLKAAERFYRRVLKRDKNNPDALYLLGTLLYQTGDLKRAEKALRLAMAERPSHPETLYNLARALMDVDEPVEAEFLLTQVLTAQPKNVSALRNLGVVRLRAHNPAAAQGVLEQALELEPGAAETWCDLGLAYSQAGEDKKSERAFGQALSLDPNHARARHNLGHLKLRQGRFKDGWADYDARKFDSQAAFKHRPFEYPEWRGEDLTGKTILVWGEQGLGDQILHASMLLDLIKCAGHVVVECEPRLVSLFRRSFAAATVVATTEPPRTEIAAAQPDYQVSSGSLGRWVRLDRAAFPDRSSYLICDSKAVIPRSTLSEPLAKPRIGVSWKSARTAFGAPKSTDLGVDWGPIFQNGSDADYFSVQYGDVRADLKAAQHACEVNIHANLGFDVTQDIDELATFLTSLSLLITTSNTTAHLAGALGVPVWCLMPRGPGRLWYWFDGEQSSLWYPSMTLYRQKSAGKWDEVFDQVASDLRAHFLPD